MDRDTSPNRLTEAQQRARRIQAESQQRLQRQAESAQNDLQQVPVSHGEGRRAQQPMPSNYRAAHEQYRQRPPGGGLPPYGGSGGGGRPPYPPEGYRHQPDGEDSQGPPRGRPPRQRSRWFVAFMMVAATLALCLFVSLFLVQSAFDMLGLSQEDRPVEVVIPEDAEISDIVRILGQAEVVTHPATFRFYLNFRSVQAENLLPGTYIFNSQMSYDELIRAMMTGRTVRDVVRLTFIEGWTLWDYARHLEEHDVVSAEEFIEYLSTANFGFEFFNMIERSPRRLHMLEGYLFPDTYDFYVGESVSSVTRKFLRNFNDRVMTPQMLARMEYMGLTVDQTITLASIIQREAGLSDDMRIVSSVFHNRLISPNFASLESDVTWLYIRQSILPRFFPEIDPDSDVTTGYILESVMPYLTPAQRAIIEAYDTYIVEGLPIGPVCNPGMDAIMAALHPEDTVVPFFFFVTDVNGDFYYAATYAQHQQNIALALSVGDEIGGVDTPAYRQ